MTKSTGSGAGSTGPVEIMSEALSVADVLDRAADLIEPEGKWSGHNCYDGCCAALAIDDVAGAISHPDGVRARRFFATFLAVEDSTLGIYRWNDAPERTQAEVVAKLREAAAKAREQSA